MLDWSARVDDLADHLAREYAIYDRSAIAILLAALINCPRTASVWLVLETNWYARECLDAWFSFGEQWVPCSLPRLRARSPWREIEAETKEWLDSPSDEHLFVEPDFERYPYFHRLTQSQYILQRSLRLRTHSNRAADPLRSLDSYSKDRRTDELAAITRHVLEDRVAARPQSPPRFIEPPDFLYYLELLQRLAPWYLDWHTLVKAFGLLGVRHAHLHGRAETDESDWQALARVAHDSIPVWIGKALALLVTGPAKSATLEKIMALEDKTRRSGHGAHRELTRLRRAGIVEWSREKMTWAITARHLRGVADILAGSSFGVDRKGQLVTSFG